MNVLDAQIVRAPLRTTAVTAPSAATCIPSYPSAAPTFLDSQLTATLSKSGYNRSWDPGPVVAPIPMASVDTATRVNVTLWRMARRAYRTSCRIVSTIGVASARNGATARWPSSTAPAYASVAITTSRP